MIRKVEKDYFHGSSENVNYPRILLVNGQAIGQRSGVGSTLANLFKGWPKDKIAQIVPASCSPDGSICSHNWLLNKHGSMKQCWVLGKSSNYFQNILMKVQEYPLTPELLKWVIDFKPQLIYSLLEIPRITNLVTKLTNVLDVKVVPHLMDDWVSSPIGIKLSNLLWFKQQHNNFKNIISHSPFALSISDEMAEEYQKLFHLPFYTFRNCADPNDFTIGKEISTIKIPLRIVYAGAGSGLGRWPIIENLAKAVQQLNQHNYQIEFTIFIHKNHLKSEPPQGNGVVTSDLVSEDFLASVLSSADIAVIAEGFNKEDIKYTHLSFSSKIPSYLMAGCCILALGPLQNNSVKYINNHNLGVVISDKSFDTIIDKLKELYNDRKSLSQFQQRNQQFALDNFNQAMVHKRLAKLLWSGSINVS